MVVAFTDANMYATSMAQRNLLKATVPRVIRNTRYLDSGNGSNKFGNHCLASFATCLWRQRSGHEEIAISSLHDTRTVNLVCAVSVSHQHINCHCNNLK